MTRHRLAAALIGCAGLFLSACNLSLLQSAVVVDVDNNISSGKTSVFAVGSAWQTRYSYDCSRANSEGVKDSDRFKLDIYNADDQSLAAENPEITLVGIHFKGVANYSRAGVYYAVVDTPCAWTLQVVDLSSGGRPATPATRAAPTGNYKLDVEVNSQLKNITCPADFANAVACFTVEATVKSPALGDLRLEELIYDNPRSGGAGDCSQSGLTGTITGGEGQQLVFAGPGGSYCKAKDSRDYSLDLSSGTGVFEQVSAGKGNVSITSHGTHEHLVVTLTFSAAAPTPSSTPAG